MSIKSRVVSQLHSMVDCLSNLGIIGEVQKVGVSGLLWEVDRALGLEVCRLNREDTTVPHRAIFQDVCLDELKAAIRITEEDQPQHGRTVFLGGNLGVCAQQIRRLPQFRLKLSDIDHLDISLRCNGVANIADVAFEICTDAKERGKGHFLAFIELRHRAG